MDFCQSGSINNEFFGLMFYLIAWTQIFAIAALGQTFLTEFFRDKFSTLERIGWKNYIKNNFYMKLCISLCAVTISCYIVLFYLKFKC